MDLAIANNVDPTVSIWLGNGDFTFLNVLGGLCFPITVSNQIAL